MMFSDLRRVSFATAIAVFLSSVLLSTAHSEESRVAKLAEKHASVLKTYCYDCHDSSSEEAGVNLETLSSNIGGDMETAGMWQKVLGAINSGEMPPEDHAPIPDAAKLAFLEDLTAQMVQARRILGDSKGKIPLRRLNRREYANTIESLVGVRPDVSLLPADQTGAGFDTQGASLFISSNQIEQYLASAHEALSKCFRAETSTRKFKKRVEVEEDFIPKYRVYLDELEANNKKAQAFLSQSTKNPSDFGLIDEYQAKKYTDHHKSFSPLLKWYFKQPENRNGGAMIMIPKNLGMAVIKLPPTPANMPGRYRVRVRVGMYPDAFGRYKYLEFSDQVVSKQRDYLGCRKVNASLKHPEILEFDVEQLPGESLDLRIHQRTHQDRGDKNLWTAASKKNGFGIHPGLWVDWAEIELIEPSATLLQRKSQILGDRGEINESDYVADVMHRFASLAFRGRVPSEAYFQKLETIYQDIRNEGQSIQSALIEPLAIMLASPEFLYMVNEGEPNSIRLTQIELANRLAFMLWSEPADEALISAAQKRLLNSPDVLRAQTTRLLSDPRSDRFVHSFTHQWLQMDRLGMFQFDGAQFPTFDNAVRENARDEIFQTLDRILRDRLPLGNLLQTDFVVINDLLAEYYDIPDVKGHAFRKVTVGEDSIRGGLLGTAAVSAMGSDGLRSSPVERGVWILRHLLHDPPAPAPPNVPQLSRLDGELVSAREIQKLHQEQPQCAQCHRKIDPLGFGLENFSAAGLWREVETVRVSKKKANQTKEFEIDPSGQLPSGEPFENFQQMRSLVASKEDQFARGFVEELIAYGLGRPYGFSDEMLVETIIEDCRDSGYTIEDILHSFIQSDSFRSK